LSISTEQQQRVDDKDVERSVFFCLRKKGSKRVAGRQGGRKRE